MLFDRTAVVEFSTWFNTQELADWSIQFFFCLMTFQQNIFCITLAKLGDDIHGRALVNSTRDVIQNYSDWSNEVKDKHLMTGRSRDATYKISVMYWGLLMVNAFLWLMPFGEKLILFLASHAAEDGVLQHHSSANSPNDLLIQTKN